MVILKYIKSAIVRTKWHDTLNDATRKAPVFIKRNSDSLCLMNVNFLMDMLENFSLNVTKTINDDGTVTFSCNELGISKTVPDTDRAVKLFAQDIWEYAENFYKDYGYWSKVISKKSHIPYVMKILMMYSPENIADIIELN